MVGCPAVDFAGQTKICEASLLCPQLMVGCPAVDFAGQTKICEANLLSPLMTVEIHEPTPTLFTLRRWR
jgi:hypothetical protein